ncbi:hypothetical protein [Melittangium boletus]|uniref:Uncharacterized protein n=1 Tax=Melittangium boletus DSM 14713 TaxID=1294270 RepID=A0A250ICD4_9BACT|nr:hypothetical protein [Melittangium boletus]ATB29514.1 hypothetical protein MEBOL_002964 [Melittangium boletus DSM 14713]
MSLRPLLAVLWLWPGVALAGMPFVQLTDLATQRLEALSFFLGLFLLVTLAVKALWNRLARDVPRLPRLGSGAALALVFLWTLGFQLVLSMIAGGRELMTPGAWEKSGTTYALKGAPPLSDTEWMLQARRQRLEELRDALWVHASQHGQRFPASDLSPELPEARWRVVGGSGLHFIYVGGQTADAPKAPLAYEPGLFGPSRWVLFTDGDIRQLPLRDIHAALQEGAP